MLLDLPVRVRIVKAGGASLCSFFQSYRGSLSSDLRCMVPAGQSQTAKVDNINDKSATLRDRVWKGIIRSSKKTLTTADVQYKVGWNTFYHYDV